MFNILLVDDEPQLCRILQKFLEGEGFVCSVAMSVEEAKHQLNEQAFDLVLTDINMPKTSGLVLIEHLRRYLPDTGVIVISAIDKPEEARKCLELGVHGYLIKPFSNNLLLITIENALRRQQLEKNERKSKHSSEEKNRLIMEHIGTGVALIAPNGRVLEMNRKMQDWFPQVETGTNLPCYQLFGGPRQDKPCRGCPTMSALVTGQVTENIVGDYRAKDRKTFRITASPVTDSDGSIIAAIEMVEDVTDKLIMEQELRQAQKLEAIGQLASGIAHEINTPIQYITDNVRFLEEAYGDIVNAINKFKELFNSPTLDKTYVEHSSIQNAAQIAIDDLDWDYLREEIPKSIEQSLDGLQKVTHIVRAMKQVSYPGLDKRQQADLNHLLENVIIVSRNEWKYIADVATDLSPDLPLLQCFPDKLNQVFLNLLVNAAHAVGTSVEQQKFTKGQITVSTSSTPTSIRVQIVDNGCGIPDDIKEKVYNLFFTTKSAGKGTGQGLAIARRVIEEEHQGALCFESKEGYGTTFIIDLPVTSDMKSLEM